MNVCVAEISDVFMENNFRAQRSYCQILSSGALAGGCFAVMQVLHLDLVIGISSELSTLQRYGMLAICRFYLGSSIWLAIPYTLA
ncbi:unnamed protein product [Caretta caretta]